MVSVKLKSIGAAKILMGTALLLQLFSFLYNGFLPHKINALIFFGSSLFFGIAILWAYYKQPVAKVSKIVYENKYLKWALSFIALGCLIYGFDLLNTAFIGRPIDAKQSDIIPTIIELCQRQFDGLKVYEPIEKFGYHLPVTYLPMQWMPYLLAYKYHFDYRWIAIGIWVIAFLIFVYRSFKYNAVFAHFLTILLSILPFIFIASNVKGALGGIVLDSVEFMVVGYYMLLVWSISSNNPILRGIIVGVCLMSRYSLVIWLPAALVILWMNEPRKQVLITLSTVLVFIVCIYIIPYLSNDWTAFFKGYKYYDQSALGEWSHLSPATNQPYHLYNGFGIASFIYEHKALSPLPVRISFLQKLHLFAAIGVMLGSIIIYFKMRKNIHYKIFLLASFKIYFAVFVFLIQVPYQYLMLVDLMVTIAIFSTLLTIFSGRKAELKKDIA